MKRVIIVLALVASALAVADYLAWRRHHHRMLDLAESSGLSHRRPEIGLELRRKTTSTRAATLLAWNLLDLETDRGWLADLPAAERQSEVRGGRERLRLASRLAEEILPRSPASWRAVAVLGASRYLLAGREGRRDQPASTWRWPLVTAMRLAPHYSEPPLLLAAAELSLWSVLSPAEREQALPVLARAFEEPKGFDLLLSTWIRLAPSLSRLLEPIPNHAPAWERLGREFRHLGDLERFAAAHGKWLESLPAFFDERVANARERLRAGERRSAYDLLRSVVAAPHDMALVDTFSAALALLPDEAVSGRTVGHLHRWLSWALDLCVLGRCPLDAETLTRLIHRIPDPEGVDLALAALAAGQPDRAQQLQPAASDGDAPGWTRYWIYRAQRLAELDRDAARRALSRAARRAHEEPRYWLAGIRIAEAGGDAEALELARRSLEALERPSRSPERWARRERHDRLELVAASPHGGLSIEIGATEPAGAAIELRWDGRFIGVAALQQRESHRWHFPVTPGVHLVEVTNLSGGPFRPVGLSLVPSAPAG